MKPNIHPKEFEVIAHCACGNRFSTLSTQDEIEVTICSACHPFYTGSQKLVDTAGRIQKFEKKYANKNK